MTDYGTLLLVELEDSEVQANERWMNMNDELIWIDGHMHKKADLIWNQDPLQIMELAKESTISWDVNEYDIVSLEQGKLVLRRKDDEHETQSDYRN